MTQPKPLALLSAIFPVLTTLLTLFQFAPVVPPNSSSPVYAGWAISAYPDMSYEQMVKDLQRMKDNGANVVWVSHANPANSFVAAREVGINPAVWRAYINPVRFPHQEAIEIVEATRRMLRACQAVGLKAVISAGYHTQMGPDWSSVYPDHLRRKADGREWKPLDDSEPYASIYSPQFRKDLHDYFVWFDFTFATAFRETILMLNLADEPLGGDYSKWAETEFQKRTGYTFAQVGNSPLRQMLLGEFQSGMVADYMKLAAGYWQEILPGMPVTMSFDGGAMRDDAGLPTVEQLFREAPANFVLSWDMYPRDRGSLDESVSEKDISQLFHLTKIIAGYSVQYKKPVWFWSAANSWGLGQGQGVRYPGTVADAQANLLYLAMLMQQQGGFLQGIAVWNYNIKTQGLYNYSFGEVKNRATWNEDEMFERVSSEFKLVRQIMNLGRVQKSSPQLLFLRPPEWQYRQIGLQREHFHEPLIDWSKLDVLLRADVVSAEIAHWPTSFPTSWDALKIVVVLTPVEYLMPGDLKGLREWVKQGGQLVAQKEVADEVAEADVPTYTLTPQVFAFGDGFIYSSTESPATLFDSERIYDLFPFWRDLFGILDLYDGYPVQLSLLYLHYNIQPNSIRAALPAEWGRLYRYTPNGSVLQLDSTQASVYQSLRRSEFILSYRFKNSVYGMF